MRHNEAPVRRNHRLRRQRRRRRHAIRIHPARRATHPDQPLRKPRPKLLPPARLRHRRREVPLPHRPHHHLAQHPPPPSHRSVLVISPSKELPHAVVHHHIPRPGIECHHRIQPRPRRNRRQIRNPTQIQQHPIHLRRAEQAIIQHWHQRSALAARRHIRRTEVAHHRAAHPLGHHRRLAHLPRRSSPPPPRTRRMMHRLPVASHQPHPHAKLFRRLFHTSRIDLPKPPVQPAHLGRRLRLALHHTQNRCPHRLRVPRLQQPDQPHPRRIPLPRPRPNPAQRHIDPIRRRPAHHSRHHHRFSQIRLNPFRN